MLVWGLNLFNVYPSVPCFFSWQTFCSGHKSANADHLKWRRFHVIGLLEIFITSLFQEYYSYCTRRGNKTETGKEREVIYFAMFVRLLLLIFCCDMSHTVFKGIQPCFKYIFSQCQNLLVIIKQFAATSFIWQIIKNTFLLNSGPGCRIQNWTPYVLGKDFLIGNFSLFFIHVTCNTEIPYICAQMWKLDTAPFKFLLRFYKVPIDQLLW